MSRQRHSLLRHGTFHDPLPICMLHRSGEVSELTVTLLGDLELASSLEEIERMNSREGGPRTPMMSVVQAVIANAGGTISIRDLAEQVRRYWNRPFPTSPYTPEEFMYVTGRQLRRLANQRIAPLSDCLPLPGLLHCRGRKT